MNSDPLVRDQCGNMRAAAIANMYVGLANNGGLNSFLTSSYEFSSQEVLDALMTIGAHEAAAQLALVVQGLGAPLMQSTQDERWALMLNLWKDDLDQYETLSEEANIELMGVLERHVDENEEYYRALTA